MSLLVLLTLSIGFAKGLKFASKVIGEPIPTIKNDGIPVAQILSVDKRLLLRYPCHRNTFGRSTHKFFSTVLVLMNLASI